MYSPDATWEGLVELLWHRLLAKLLEQLLSSEGVTVLSELPATSNPPEIDLLLLRRNGLQWTESQRALLPDGIRDHHCAHHLLECKITESVTEQSLQQALTYDYLYRQSQGLSSTEVQTYELEGVDMSKEITIESLLESLAMTQESTISYIVDQQVATITLNRPEKRNAFTPAMLQALHAAFVQADADEAVRAVLVTGAGKGFCAGQDLAIFDGLPSPDRVREIVLDYYRPMILSIVALKKPVIAAINGVAAGAGASLALACDLRIMAHDASILMAFSNIGLVPDAGASWFLTRLVGYSRAFEIATLGERITAERSLELGLTNWVTGADTLAEDAQARARHLAQRPTVALGMTKLALQRATQEELETILTLEADLQAEAAATADHLEGVTAFVEKRSPVFRGQ